jgi:hypothetical protein
VVAFSTISSSDTASASTLFNVERQVGSAFGVAASASVLALLGAQQSAALGSYHAAMLLCAGFALVGALFSLRLRDFAPVEPVSSGAAKQEQEI